MKASSLFCLAFLLTAGSAAGENSVVVESKTFAAGQTACTVGVFISNSSYISCLSLPVELRELSPGAFSLGSILVEENPLGRIYGSRISDYGFPPGAVTRRYLPATDGPPCSGMHSPSYKTSGPPDYQSPDAVLLAAANGHCSDGEEWEWCILAPGSDPLGTDSSSYQLLFAVSNVPGQFEIDTCCILPANHLAFVDARDRLVLPSFTKGTITILPCGCPCDAEPVCDGIDDIADVAALIDVAFGGVSDTRDPACWATQTDVNADGRTDIVDVVRMIFVAIHNQPREAYFVDPCL